MKKFMMAALSLCAITSSLTSIQHASAEGYAHSNGSYKVQKNALQKADWNVTPLEYQILDTRPTVRDFRTPDVEPDKMVFDLSPLQSVPGKTIRMGGGSGNGGGSPFKSAPNHLMSLPRVGFGSEANAPLQHVNTGHLPDGRSIGSHAPVTSQQSVRGELNKRLETASTPVASKAQPALSYGTYKTQPTGSTSTANIRVDANATGKLLGRLQKK